MGNSPSAEAVAYEVLATIRAGKIPNKQEIQIRHGYSPTSARAMKATGTASYKKVMEPVVKQLEETRRRAISMLAEKVDTASYRDLVYSVDKFTKNIQLLSGGATENVTVGFKNLSDAELQRLADGKDES